MIKKTQVIFSKISLFLILSLFLCGADSPVQVPEELECSLDLNSPAVSLPAIYKTNIDLSGRGKRFDKTLPQNLASGDAISAWQADLGFGNFYRIQYNLWEIQRLAGDKDSYRKILDHYDEIIKKISDSGGTVVLDLFGTPDGLGTVLDKNSAPHNLKVYKELVKDTIRRLSCEKKYNIWYEVWNAPDIGDFFLGQRSDYLNLYRIVGEAVKELRQETKAKIPLGGPSVSAWFRNIEPNSILTPERSLIYELIKYCYSYRLPLDFISWHAYSSDPKEEKQSTIYNKPFVGLIREWLTYFKFDSNIPLLVDEWNFDGSANIPAARDKNANISASYIPARLKNMYEAGIDRQIYFCLEDFVDYQAGIVRNLGVFTFDAGRPENRDYAKVNFNVWRMINMLGPDLLQAKCNDEFVGIIATRTAESAVLLVYNYIDPQLAMNYLSRNIVNLNGAEKKAILGIINSDRMKKVLAGQISLSTLRLSAKTKEMLSRAIELYGLKNKFSTAGRKIKISLKGLKGLYLLSVYTVNGDCVRNCEFKPAIEKEVDFDKGDSRTLELSPYSVQLLVFKKKPPVPAEVPPAEGGRKPPAIKAESGIAKPLEAKTDIVPAGSKIQTKPSDKETGNAENK